MSVRTLVLFITFLVLLGFISGNALRRNIAWVALINAWGSAQSASDFDVSRFEALESRDFQHLVGLHAYFSGDCQQAEQAFEHVLAASPDDQMVLFFAGHASYQCGDQVHAIEYWQHAGAAPKILTWCRDEYAASAFDRARTWCQLAIASAPSFAEAHLQLGLVYQMQRDHRNALASLERSAALNAQQEMVFFQIGLAQRALGDLPGAELNLRREIEINPSYSGPWYVIGLNYFDQQRYVEAVDYLLTAIELDDQRRAMAETYVVNAIEQNPTMAGAHYTLARLYVEQKRYEEARNALLEADRLDSSQFPFSDSSQLILEALEYGD